MMPRLLTSPWRRCQELPAHWAIVFEAQPLERIRLRFDEEVQELRQINRVLAVVVFGGTADPAGPTRGGGGFVFQRPDLRQRGIAGTAGQRLVQISRSRPRSPG